MDARLMMATIVDGAQRQTVEFEGETLLSALLAQAGYPQDLPCGGKGKCGKCRVKATGALSPASAQEIKLLGQDALTAGERLCCLARAVGDVRVELHKKAEVEAVAFGQMPVLSASPLAATLGAAVDVGTTTVAVYLYDCVRGALLGQDTFKNPQQIFGADVISRIEAYMRGEHIALQGALASKLESTLLALLDSAQRKEQELDAMVITGNTTMMDILTLTDVTPLSRSPFAIDAFFGESYPAEALGFANLSASVYIPRTISAFVGSDITCAALSCAIDGAQKPTMLVDIGTNGEMAIAHKGALHACSTAAGPAFEGAGITFGSVARAGAIDRVWLEDGRMAYTTLHGEPAVGLGGSGLIDAVAALLEAGLIDDTGAIDEGCEAYEAYLTEWEDQPAVRIGDSDILLTQKDVRAVQLAKSAICSGLTSLMHEINLCEEDIDKLYIAGGFGAFIRMESAAAIGLIPQSLAARAVAVGNAAGMGALSMLLDRDACARGADLAARMQVLELSSSPYFMDQYVENMMFPV